VAAGLIEDNVFNTRLSWRAKFRWRVFFQFSYGARHIAPVGQDPLAILLQNGTRCSKRGRGWSSMVACGNKDHLGGVIDINKLLGSGPRGGNRCARQKFLAATNEFELWLLFDSSAARLLNAYGLLWLRYHRQFHALLFQLQTAATVAEKRFMVIRGELF